MDKNIKTTEAVDLIWKHSHKDQLLLSDGVKMIMYPAPMFGLGPIIDLPIEVFVEKLKFAQRKEIRLLAFDALKPILLKHGVLDQFQSTEQWRDTELDVCTFAGFHLKGQALEAFSNDVKAANITFPDK